MVTCTKGEALPHESLQFRIVFPLKGSSQEELERDKVNGRVDDELEKDLFERGLVDVESIDEIGYDEVAEFNQLLRHQARDQADRVDEEPSDRFFAIAVVREVTVEHVAGGQVDGRVGVPEEIVALEQP